MLQSGNVTTFILFVVGVFLLISGAEILVRGASRLASAVGISPLVIGLTVVAYGTSSAEFSVCVRAALSGQSSLAIGSMVGSNIFNILFTLGVSALIAPLAVSRQVVRWDVSVLIASSVLLLVLSLDEKVSRWDSVVLLMGIVIYTIFAVRRGRKQGATIEAGQTQDIKERNLKRLPG
jgi:cation:H+ antiporter